MTEIKINESQSQEIGKYYDDFSKKYNIDLNELVYGEDGFMNSCYPDGFPDFAGDVIYSEKYWNEFEKWLKDTKGIELTEGKLKDLKDKANGYIVSSNDKERYQGYKTEVVNFITKELNIPNDWNAIKDKFIELGGDISKVEDGDEVLDFIYDKCKDKACCEEKEAIKKFKDKDALEKWLYKNYEGAFYDKDENRIETGSHEEWESIAKDLEIDGAHMFGSWADGYVIDLSDYIKDTKEEYNAKHAEEWMEKHPYGWYNNENDYGTGDEEDEEDFDESLTEDLGDDFYGYKEGTEEADDVLFALQVQYGRPEYDYDDFRKLNLAKEKVEKAINYVKEKGYDKFTYFGESLNEEQEDYLSTEEFLSWHDGRGGLEAPWELLQNIYDIFRKNGFSEDDDVDVAYEGCPETDKVTITKFIKDDITNKHLNENFSITDALKMLNE